MTNSINPNALSHEKISILFSVYDDANPFVQSNKGGILDTIKF